MPMGTLATIWPPQIDSAATAGALLFTFRRRQRIAISPARLAARAFLATRARSRLILAPLRMSDDDGARSGVFEHLRADVAGVSAGRFGVTILPADGASATRCPRRRGKQGPAHKSECRHAAEPSSPKRRSTRSRAAQPSVHESSNYRQSTGACLSPRKVFSTAPALEQDFNVPAGFRLRARPSPARWGEPSTDPPFR
jgi:hypothetical protein